MGEEKEQEEKIEQEANIILMPVTEPIWLGFMYAAMEKYLIEAEQDDKLNVKDILVILGKALNNPISSIRLTVAWDQTTNAVVGFSLVTIVPLLIPKLFIDALWQDKSYAQYEVKTKLWEDIKKWASENKVTEVNGILNKQASVTWYTDLGWKAKGILLSYTFEEIVKETGE